MSLVVDKVLEDIILFKLMLRANDAEKRSRARAGLQLIVGQWQGTPQAEEAKEILARDEARQPEADPELKELENRWRAIQELTNPDLPRMLRYLQSKPTAAGHLRRSIVKDLRKWISAALLRLGDNADSDAIEALESFTRLPALSAYEADVDELRQMRSSLFELHYRKVREEVMAALATWSFDEAWAAHKRIANTPANFEQAVAKLEEQIYKAKRDYDEVQRLLDQPFQTIVVDWETAAAAVQYLKELSDYLKQTIPVEWSKRLTEAKQTILDELSRFLKEKAGELRELDKLRNFQTEYSKLQVHNLTVEISLQPEWFQESINQISQNLERRIVAAESPEALDVILMGLSEQQLGLPDIIIEELNSRSLRIGELATAWRVIRIGEEFPERMPPKEPLPQAFAKAVELYSGLLQRIDEAFAKLDTHSDDALQPYLEAGELASQILEQYSGHVKALKLKEKVEHKLAYHEIHRAVSDWKIDRLLELCRPRLQEPECAYYLANEQLLRVLHELVGEDRLAGFKEAEGWWQLWRSRVQELTPNPPDALTQALAREQESRANEWHEVLAALIDSPLSPEKFEEIAASLDREGRRLDLTWRKAAFLQKAGAGYAERFIKAGKWQQAEKRIVDLGQDHDETRRLKALLSVERARQSGLGELSRVLKSDWSQVSRYLKERAYDVLTSAVQEAWSKHDDESLKNLRMVVTRLLTTRQAPPDILTTLEEWEKWLTIETYVRNSDPLAVVKKLVSYLAVQVTKTPVLVTRLEALINYWRDRNDLVMLVWAYEAFKDHIELPIEVPAEELTRVHLELAADYQQQLHDNPELDLGALKDMDSELRKAESEWSRLRDYLNELPHPTTKVELPHAFTEVSELVATLLSNWSCLDRARSVDLRLEDERKELQTCATALQNQFQDVAIKASLLKQVETLEPLTGLRFSENRIFEAADFCGDDDRCHELDAFLNLVTCLQKMIDVFRQVNAEDGYLWQRISAEYGITVHAKARSLLPKPTPSDLRVLAAQFTDLQSEEDTFRKVLRELKRRTPITPTGYLFEPESSLDYLQLFPKDPPHSRRVYVLFKEFASVEPMPTILSQSRRYLPEWICKYLDEGIPQYVHEG
jgi:hypothetical protein